MRVLCINDIVDGVIGEGCKWEIKKGETYNAIFEMKMGQRNSLYYELAEFPGQMYIAEKFVPISDITIEDLIEVQEDVFA